MSAKSKAISEYKSKWRAGGKWKKIKDPSEGNVEHLKKYDYKLR